MRIPEYRLRKDYIHSLSIQVSVTIPAWSFVKPVELKYVPEHIKEKFEVRFIDEATHVFCYTRYGFHLLPRRILEET